MFCENCEALGESCCEASKARRETAITLAKIVARQVEAMAALTRERDAARAAASDLMDLHKVAP